MTTPLAYVIDTMALNVYVNRSLPSDQNLPAKVRPYLTICMELVSKRVLAFCLSEHYLDLESMKAILYEVFLADGENKQFVSVPDEIWFDKSLLFSSLQDLTHALPITQCSMSPSPKGSVERLFLSIQNECFPRQDSSGNRFIAESTLSELEERFTQFSLHHQIHSSTVLTPLKIWQKEYRLSVFDPHVLYLLLHDGSKRRVLKDGIRYRHNTYWHSDLAYYVGKEVQIMMKPKQISPETIGVFFEQRWICFASLQEGANGDHLRNENERV